MKTYLAEVLIMDGEHEHRCFGLVKAQDEADAKLLVEEEIGGGDYWSYGDGLTETRLRSLKLVLPGEAQVVQELGLASYIN